MHVVLIGLRPEAANLLRSWLESASISVADSTAPAETIAAHCKLAIVDFRRVGPAARLARDAWKESRGLAVIAVVEDPDDGVRALQAGADDFVVSPLDPAQLIARVRRLEAGQARRTPARTVELEGLLFDVVAQTVTVGARQIRLTTKCYALSQLFLRNIGRRLSRAEIVTAIWGTRPDLNSRTLDAHVSQIRRVFLLSETPRLILRSIYGHGYELRRETAPIARAPATNLASEPVLRRA